MSRVLTEQANRVSLQVGSRGHENPMPILGMRIIKTSVAVGICLLVNMLIGFNINVCHAAFAVVVCLQPVMSDSREFARNRVLSTFVGAVTGLLCLLIMDNISYAYTHMWLAYLMMTLGTLITLYVCVVFKAQDAACLAAIVFICIVYTFPDVEAPIANAVARLLYTILGTFVAIAVNVFHLPREYKTNQLFFVRMQDLSNDRYKPLPMKVEYYLKGFYEHGANICLISRWAPAFVMSQLSALKVETPVIVMDGSALYDPRENKYLEVIEIPREDLAVLHLFLEDLGLTWCEYAVHDNRTMFIYLQGAESEVMEREYDIMVRAPYRSYRFGDYEDNDHFTTVQVLDTVERINEVEPKIREYIPESLFRIERRVHPTQPGCASLYFYTPAANVEAMKDRVASHIVDGDALTQVDITLGDRPSTERNTEQVLHTLRRLFAPVSWKGLLK